MTHKDQRYQYIDTLPKTLLGDMRSYYTMNLRKNSFGDV